MNLMILLVLHWILMGPTTPFAVRTAVNILQLRTRISYACKQTL